MIIERNKSEPTPVKPVPVPVAPIAPEETELDLGEPDDKPATDA